MTRTAGNGYFRYGAATEERSYKRHLGKLNPESAKGAAQEAKRIQARRIELSRAGLEMCHSCYQGYDLTVEPTHCPHCGNPLDDFAE